MGIHAIKPVGTEHLVPLEEHLPPEQQQKKDTTFGRRFAATMRTESDIQMGIERAQYYTDHGEPLEGYNPMNDLSQDMQPYWESFIGSHNPDI